MLHMFAENVANDELIVRTVKDSKSYPLIRELVHAFKWRVVGISTYGDSIEVGNQQFLMVDECRMPVASVYVEGDGNFNHDTKQYDDIKYCVSSKLISGRGYGRNAHTYKSNKIPYLIKNLKKKTTASEGQNQLVNFLGTCVGQFRNGLEQVVGRERVSMHDLKLTPDDILGLLEHYFKSKPIYDESKYKTALDLFGEADQNKSELNNRWRDALWGSFNFIYAVDKVGLYRVKASIEDVDMSNFLPRSVKTIEPPVFYNDLSELEDEIPALTMLKVLNEGNTEGAKSIYGVPQTDKFYDELDMSSYYMFNTNFPFVTGLIVPCPKV